MSDKTELERRLVDTVSVYRDVQDKTSDTETILDYLMEVEAAALALADAIREQEDGDE